MSTSDGDVAALMLAYPSVGLTRAGNGERA